MNQLKFLLSLILSFAVLFLPEQCHAGSFQAVIAQVQTAPAVSYVVEAGIVILLFAGAIYAVCKTSYRR